MSAADLIGAHTAANGELVVLERSAAWTSLDGRTFSRRPTGAPVEDAIVRGRAGAYLLLDPSTHQAWESPDGHNWDRLGPDVQASGLAVVDVAVADNGHRVVVTCPRDPQRVRNGCRTHISTDGANWQSSDTLDGDLRVAWFGDAWVAAALVRPDSGPMAELIEIYRSVDGRAWERASAITEGFVNGAPERLYAAGDYLVLRAGTSYTRSFICDADLTCGPLGVDTLITRGAAAGGDVLVVGGGSRNGPGGTVWSWEISE